MKVKPKAGRARKLLAADESDESEFGATAAKTKKAIKSSDEKPPAAKKAKVAAVKTKKSKNVFESSDEESGSDVGFGEDVEVVPRERTGRERKPANYNFGYESNSDSSDDFA